MLDCTITSAAASHFSPPYAQLARSITADTDRAELSERGKLDRQLLSAMRMLDLAEDPKLLCAFYAVLFNRELRDAIALTLLDKCGRVIQSNIYYGTIGTVCLEARAVASSAVETDADAVTMGFLRHRNRFGRPVQEAMEARQHFKALSAIGVKFRGLASSDGIRLRFLGPDELNHLLAEV